jgi:hypothetical protein
MEAKRAARILRALADGTDPFTGEVVEDRGPLQNLECIRALFAAVEVLEGRASTQNRRDRENHCLTNRVGKPWHEREDEELTERFDAGWNVADLAKHHQRTQVAIRARLVRLGKIANRRDA